MFKLGKSIKTFRMNAGLSQRQLADRAELTSSFLSLIESGDREPSLAAVRKIAKALDLPEEVLIWDAVQIPTGLNTEDQRLCEAAKTLVKGFFETPDVRANSA